jgi:hypothetical protein
MNRHKAITLMIFIIILAAMLMACNTVAYSTDPRIIATCEAMPAHLDALNAMRTAVP